MKGLVGVIIMSSCTQSQHMYLYVTSDNDFGQIKLGKWSSSDTAVQKFRHRIFEITWTLTNSELLCAVLQWRGVCAPCRLALRWPNWREKRKDSSDSFTWMSTSPASDGDPRGKMTRPKVSYHLSELFIFIFQHEWNHSNRVTVLIIISSKHANIIICWHAIIHSKWCILLASKSSQSSSLKKV